LYWAKLPHLVYIVNRRDTYYTIYVLTNNPWSHAPTLPSCVTFWTAVNFHYYYYYCVHLEFIRCSYFHDECKRNPTWWISFRHYQSIHKCLFYGTLWYYYEMKTNIECVVLRVQIIYQHILISQQTILCAHMVCIIYSHIVLFIFYLL